MDTTTTRPDIDLTDIDLTGTFRYALTIEVQVDTWRGYRVRLVSEPMDQVGGPRRRFGTNRLFATEQEANRYAHTILKLDVLPGGEWAGVAA